jgi:hypothetical protein
MRHGNEAARMSIFKTGRGCTCHLKDLWISPFTAPVGLDCPPRDGSALSQQCFNVVES